MKAAIYTKYGSPDVIEIKNVEKPVPKDNEVLIKVHSASLNPLDWHFMRGKPLFMRLTGLGVFVPKNKILGNDKSGTVVEFGKNVKNFQVGDEVFGENRGGGFAEYASVPEGSFTHKPSNISFDEAAAIPIAGVTALQALCDKGQIKYGQKVLINGASGGVGTFAIQIAKYYGTEVTAVCSTSNIELVSSIGADYTIDYMNEDFTKQNNRYDIILDTVANHSLLKMKHYLNPKGTYILVGGDLKRLFQMMMFGKLFSNKKGKNLTFQMTKTCQVDLLLLKNLCDTKKVIPVIDRSYSLKELSSAIEYLEKRHAKGKIIIKI